MAETELIRTRGPGRSLEAVEFATLERVDRFNHRRLLAPIGHVSPAETETETAYDDALETAETAT